MISILEAIILGIVQGITEWLPISSSGHLVLFQELFGLKMPVVFDVFLHLGSLLVIIMVFWKDIKKLVKGVFRRDKYYLKYFFWLVLASIPIGFVGYFFNDAVKSAFTDINVVGYSLLATAVILFLSRFPKKKKLRLNWQYALFMGIGQAFAILPGVSRSGTTISFGLMQGVERKEAARFAFLLFIPAILGATILEFNGVSQITNVSALVIGMIVTVVVGFFSLKLLLRILEKQKFSYFGWYCLVLGLVILLVA